MRIFQKISKSALAIWVISFSVALLSAQNLKLHTHNLDHDHVQGHEHISIEETHDHLHLADAHFSIDISHADHHDEVVSEVKVSPDGLMKNDFSKVLTLALLAVLLVLLLPSLFQSIFYRWHNEFIFTRRYQHSPPLRAPPR